MKKQLTYQIKKAYRESLVRDDFLKAFIFRISDIITVHTGRNYTTFKDVRKDILYLSTMSKCNHYPARKYLELIEKYVAGIIKRYEAESKPDTQEQLNDFFAV